MNQDVTFPETLPTPVPDQTPSPNEVLDVLLDIPF